MDIILAALATWRIASLLARENGPMWIFSNFRVWLEKKAKKSAAFASLFEGIECVWCNSMWFAFFFAFFVEGNYLVNWLALSSMAIIIDSLIGKLNG